MFECLYSPFELFTQTSVQHRVLLVSIDYSFNRSRKNTVKQLEMSLFGINFQQLKGGAPEGDDSEEEMEEEFLEGDFSSK